MAGMRGVKTCLVVHQSEAEDVGEHEHDRAFVVVALRSGDVALDAANFLNCTYGEHVRTRTVRLETKRRHTFRGTLVFEAC